MTGNTLEQLYAAHEGKVSDKWSIYFNEYERIFDNYRDNPIRLLEIGIQNGGSLEIWSKYFFHAQKLVGCDINPDCARLSYEDPRIAVVVGDANSDSTLTKILEYASAFDVIIDDGSHRSSDIVKSFARYFPHLADGGVFVVEDLHCSYWQEFEGGLFDPFSSMAFFKRLVDIASHEHWGIEKACTDILSGFFSKYDFQMDAESLPHVHSVEFINSMCVIRKARPECNQLGTRNIVGSVEGVVSRQVLHSGLDSVPDQRRNEWAARSMPPDEELLIRIKELADRNAQVASLIQAVAERDGQIASLTQVVAERDVQITSLTQTVAVLKNSTCWRITKPLRYLGTKAKKAKGLIQNLPSTIRIEGGWHTLINKATHVYRIEGLQGVRRRLVEFSKKEQKYPVNLNWTNSQERYDYLGFAIKGQRHHNIPSKRNLNLVHRLNEARFFTSFGEARNILISIITPVYNTEEKFLSAAIDSVLAQHYQNWELVLVDDGSSSEKTLSTLRKYAHEDKRIQLLHRKVNGGISTASNDALNIANGKFVGLLDHDDLLDPNALLEVIRVVKLWPEVDFIYSDEDKLSPDGLFHSAYYKPDWSPELLLSTMYTSHFSVYRTELLKSIGGFRPEYDGTQDYDLALRVSEVTRNVCHIPLILYHWRETPTSTAQNIGHKSYAIEAQKRALEDALRRRGVKGEVCPLPYAGNWRVRYDLKDKPLISIVIPSATREAVIRGSVVNLAVHCVESILSKTTYSNYEIVLVHNLDTTDAIKQALKNCERVQLVEYSSVELNLAEKINVGVRTSQGKLVLILNDDIEVITGDWLETMAGAFEARDAGVVGAKLFFENGTVQHAGIVWTDPGPTHAFINFAPHNPGAHLLALLRRDVLGVTGACMMVPRDIFDELGGYDETFPLNYNDVDFCLRAREKGYRVVIDPHAQLYHFESISKAGVFRNELGRLQERWGRIDDPFYNPNYERSNPFFMYSLRHIKYPLMYEDCLELEIVRGQRGVRGHRALSDDSIYFSILTGVYNTPHDFLLQLAETIFSQTYCNFEWILIDDCSESEDTRRALLKLVSLDSRVRVHRLDRNVGIVAGLHKAITLSRGNFVLTVDHDDLLTCDALDIFSGYIKRNPECKIFYSDEDKSDEHGRRFSPFVKPDFDPLLLASCCYVAHLHCFDRLTAISLGVYADKAAEGCHDWDTFYKFIDSGFLPEHVPFVTYSWRIHNESTASGRSDVKPYTVTSQDYVLKKHLEFLGKSQSHDIGFDQVHGTWHLNLTSSCAYYVSLISSDGSSWLVSRVSTDDSVKRKEIGQFGRFSEALQCAISENQFVVYQDKKVRPINKWISEGIGVLTFFDEVAMFGGLIFSESCILCAGLYSGFADGLRSPFAGLPVGSSGYYGLVSVPKTVDFVSPLLWGVKSSFVREAIEKGQDGNNSVELFLRSLYQIIQQRGARVAYVPSVSAKSNLDVLAKQYSHPMEVFDKQNGYLYETSCYYSSKFSSSKPFELRLASTMPN